jgi:hypothetical protein
MKIKLTLLALMLFGFSAAAQLQQFTQPTYLTITTNSGVLIATPVQVNVPSISLTITATNSYTMVTNNLFNTIFINGSNYVISQTFVYNAATMGTNFTTNFPPSTIVLTNYTFGQAIPQAGGSNTCYIK